ncbi:EamA family transporter [Castellaniella defragrans]|uniref:Inner membrane transporter RhtA n=2 Tax=Castellaniella defragrans TaxID=75697 RepID=A0A7W9TNR8_CASDE|nr:EamA family transporter [Castellaniella defragrans]MBB6083521.1 inner membrane transporter RhtA [Castellaniella defragrans]
MSQYDPARARGRASGRPGPGIGLAVGLAVAAMVSVQTGVSLAVPVIHDYGALSTSGLRLCWAALALLLFVRPPLHRYGAAQWRAALVLGTAMAVMSLAFFLAIERLPQHLTVALEFCGPLAVAALGARGWRALAWPLLAAAGIGLLVSGDAHAAGGADPAGIAYALLAAAGWGVYIVMMKRIGPAFPGLQGLTVSLAVAALLSLPFAAGEAGTIRFPWEQLAFTAGLAVLVPLVPYILEITALRRMPAATFGVLMSLEPAVGATAGWIFLSQGMSAGQMLGTGLVVAASVGVVRARR